MKLLNRSAIVVRPRQPFLDWLRDADSTSINLTLLDLVREPTIYLIPECDSSDEVDEVLHELCEESFGEPQLIPRASLSMSQFRLYTADDVARLTFIKQMQGLGFSLQEIKQLLDLRARGGHACRDVRELLDCKLTEIRHRIRNLQSLECELVLDLKKCNRELKNRRGHDAQRCPIFSETNERTQ